MTSQSRRAARELLGPALALLTRPTALDKLEIDNCVTGMPDTGLANGPPIDPRDAQEPDPPKQCLGTGLPPGVDPSTTSTTTTAPAPPR